MEFSRLIQGLKKELKKELPGTEVQWQMASSDRRIKDFPREKNADSTLAAVLVLLYPHDKDICTIFIQRPVYDGVHSGQISFPGGKAEEGDKNLQETAIRESCEEIGVCSKDLNIIGKLTPLYIPPSDTEVSPFVACCSSKPLIKHCKEEVVSVIEARLQGFLDGSIIKEKPMLIRDEELMVKYYDYEGHVIWGASAMMFYELMVVISQIQGS